MVVTVDASMRLALNLNAFFFFLLAKKAAVSDMVWRVGTRGLLLTVQPERIVVQQAGIRKQQARKRQGGACKQQEVCDRDLESMVFCGFVGFVCGGIPTGFEYFETDPLSIVL